MQYLEFYLKAGVGIIAAVVVLLRASRGGAHGRGHAVERLRLPLVLASAFFVLSFLLASTGLLARAVEFDPALPLWAVFCTLKLLLIGYLAGKSTECVDGQLRRFHRLLLLVIFSGAALLEVVLILPAAPLLGPARLDVNGVTLQTLQVTCVPSALSTVCRLYGEPVNEYEATRRVKTLFAGSLPGHSITGCRNLGFDEAAYSDQSITVIIGEDLPFLITVGSGINRVEHAIAVVGSRDGLLYLADPLRGLVIIPLQKFMEKQQFSIIRLGRRSGAVAAPSLRGFAPEDLKKGV